MNRIWASNFDEISIVYLRQGEACLNNSSNVGKQISHAVIEMLPASTIY